MTVPRPSFLPDHGLSCTPIQRVELDSPEARRLVELNQPFVCKARGAMLDWDVPTLKARAGDLPIRLRRRNGTMDDVTLSFFLDLVMASKGHNVEFTVGDYELPFSPVVRIWHPFNGPVPEMRTFRDDVVIPSFIREDKISSINLWTSHGPGPSANHCEPNAMANFNVQIRGKKHVWLFSPNDAKCLSVLPAVMEPPFVANDISPEAVSVAHPPFRDAHCLEAVLEEGDAIFIPVFWFHWFVHYPVYQLNMNIWWEPDQIPLSPMSGDWVYMSALCKALGGFDKAAEQFARLPAETQALLRQIERNLLDDVSLTRSKPMLDARSHVKQPRIPDPKTGAY